MCEIVADVAVFPTEDIDRVRQAVLTLFPGAETEMDTAKDRVVARVPDMGHFAERLADQKIRDSARAFLHTRIMNGTLIFHLNKQAALMDRVNFTEGDSMLGDVRVEARSADPEGLVDDWTARDAHPAEAER